MSTCKDMADIMNFSIVRAPLEILLHIFSHASVQDLSRLRQVCRRFQEVVDKEQVWIAKAKKDFSINLRVEAEKPSPRTLFQHLIFRFKTLFGKWQRLNLRFYSSLAEFKWDPLTMSIALDNLLPSSKLSKPLDRVRFLQVGLEYDEGKWKTKITNLDRMTNSQGVTMALDARSLDIMIPNTKDYTISPAEWRELLAEFISRNPGGDTMSGLEMFVSLYHSRSHFSFGPLFSNDWLDRHNFSLPGTPIRPGLFQGTFGQHGIELVHLQIFGATLEGARGVKVTGDSNVPFNEVAFRITDGVNCLDLSEEEQDSRELLQESLEVPRNVPYQDGLSLNFHVPRHMFKREELKKWTSCKGRWAAEGQTAQHMFQNPEFIGAHFILFSEDEFAVMYLGDLESISMFHRVID